MPEFEEINLGRVQPLYKGNYDSTIGYNKLDNVFYRGSTWVCIQDTNVGDTPGESNKWQLVAYGLPLPTEAHSGDILVFNGIQWVAQSPTQ